MSGQLQCNVFPAPALKLSDMHSRVQVHSITVNIENDVHLNLTLDEKISCVHLISA